ncbi:MAG: hypothetical protein K9H48_14320 [Melioribacteraceae bacterium]|nr:hypothetical protein [Melioribacteraceae bacterium]MCF8420536.1 hypothetical protein [Melioribacteraceae bacterium]
MARYKNLGGDSGISSYEIGADSIEVTFNDGSVYLYNYASAGKHNIERMKSLAASGSGLNSFINTIVKKLYASKLR